MDRVPAIFSRLSADRLRLCALRQLVVGHQAPCMAPFGINFCGSLNIAHHSADAVVFWTDRESHTAGLRNFDGLDWLSVFRDYRWGTVAAEVVCPVSPQHCARSLFPLCG